MGYCEHKTTREEETCSNNLMLTVLILFFVIGPNAFWIFCWDVTDKKTICLNCAAEITRSDLPWKPGDLEPDY